MAFIKNLMAKKAASHQKPLFFMQNTEGGTKNHKRLIINPIIKRLSVKKSQNTEGGKTTNA
jgi:peptide deformylase